MWIHSATLVFLVFWKSTSAAVQQWRYTNSRVLIRYISMLAVRPTQMEVSPNSQRPCSARWHFVSTHFFPFVTGGEEQGLSGRRGRDEVLEHVWAKAIKKKNIIYIIKKKIKKKTNSEELSLSRGLICYDETVEDPQLIGYPYRTSCECTRRDPPATAPDRCLCSTWGGRPRPEWCPANTHIHRIWSPRTFFFFNFIGIHLFPTNGFSKSITSNKITSDNDEYGLRYCSLLLLLARVNL